MKNLILPLAALLIVSCFSGQESGPVVNGQPLAFWLRTWVDKSSSTSQRADAERAFRQAGTNAIPHLLNELTVGDLVEKSATASVKEIRQALERTIAAEGALRFMGPCVTSSIPQLANLMASTNYGAVTAAAEVLSGLGPQGTHVLVSGLTNANAEAREAIPRVLRNMGTNLVVELPALFNSLDALPADAASDCSYAIIQSVVAEFAWRLSSKNSNTRYVTAMTLGELGMSAQSAIPDLEKLRDDPDKDVRNAADRALNHIRGNR